MPARSATAKPIAGVELTLLAKNNEILGTAKTDAEGRATFKPGLTRGEGGMVPAVLMASDGDKRLRLPRHDAAPASTCPIAASPGAPAPGALDVYAWTERGIYRAGETCMSPRLPATTPAKAVENLPLTFIFSRPDGVEDRRIVSDGAVGRRPCRRPAALARTPCAAPGRSRSTPIPRRRPSPRQMFLVEDFVPDRIEFDLTADKTEIAAGEAANVTVDGRFLYGAPAAGLALEGEVDALDHARMGALQRLSTSASPTSRKATRPASR